MVTENLIMFKVSPC